MVTGTSGAWALLIGVDHYMPNVLPDGISYPSLTGCVRDVEQVEEFLRRKLGLADAQILKLTASLPPGDGPPPEPEEAWPTYENIIAAFHQVTDCSAPGDQIYIHYSGHGGRAITAYPDLKGEQACDEALVPTDIGMSTARYLRDVELGYLIKQMVEKHLNVVVVLDSCHSGGATRGAGSAVKRGIESIDITPRRAESLVADPSQLAAAWLDALRDGARGTRALKPGSGWLLEPRGYTLLAACRAQESAYEYPFDGVETSGALTYWLLGALTQLGPELSYKVLHDRVLANVHGQFGSQTPQLQGEGDRRVFGWDRVQSPQAIAILRVDTAKNRILLNAGQAQAIRKGARFAVYPWGATDFSGTGQRLALVETVELEAANSWAVITSTLQDAQVKPGDQAVLLDPGSVRLRRPVRAISQSGLPDGLDQQAALERARAAIQAGGTQFAPLATDGEPAYFQIAVNNRAEYEIWDAAGSVIPNLFPALDSADSAAPEALARRLEHLAKYQNVRELENHDSLSPLARSLLVEIAGKQAEYDPVDPPDPQPVDFSGEIATIRDGEWIFVRVKNLLPPVPDSWTANLLNIAVLDLQPGWGITQVYPSAPGALFEPLDPGSEILLPFRTHLPDTYTAATDVIKVMATAGTTSFRWLELPSLDEGGPPAMRTRGWPADALEQILANLVHEPRTRNLDPAAYPSKAWTTAQVQIHIS